MRWDVFSQKQVKRCPWDTSSKVESIYFTHGHNEVVEDVAGQGVESAANLNINPKYLLLSNINPKYLLLSNINPKYLLLSNINPGYLLLSK